MVHQAAISERAMAGVDRVRQHLGLGRGHVCGNSHLIYGEARGEGKASPPGWQGRPPPKKTTKARHAPTVHARSFPLSRSSSAHHCSVGQAVAFRQELPSPGSRCACWGETNPSPHPLPSPLLLLLFFFLFSFHGRIESNDFKGLRHKVWDYCRKKPATL